MIELEVSPDIGDCGSQKKNIQFSVLPQDQDWHLSFCSSPVTSRSIVQRKGHIKMFSKTIRRPSYLKPLQRYITQTAISTPLRMLSSLPIVIKVSSQEVASNSLSLQNLELATRALHRDGLVVLEDVIDHAKLDKLNIKMSTDTTFLQSKGDAGPFNYNKGCVGCSRRHICPALTREFKKYTTRSSNDQWAFWDHYTAQQASNSGHIVGAWPKASAHLSLRK